MIKEFLLFFCVFAILWEIACFFMAKTKIQFLKMLAIGDVAFGIFFGIFLAIVN